MRYFPSAIRFLTSFAWPRGVKATPEEIGKSTPFFPIVGFGLGLVLVLLNRLLEPYLASEILSVILVTVLILMTRGQHLEGLGKTFERLGLRGTRVDGMKSMESSQIGIFGILAVLVVVVLKFRAIEVLGEARRQSLLLMPVLGRWAMVILAYRSQAASEDSGGLMVEHVRGGHLFLATLLTLVLVVILTSQLGLWVALWVSILVLAGRSYLHRRLGGIDGDSLGAIGEIIEVFSLVLFASLW